MLSAPIISDADLLAAVRDLPPSIQVLQRVLSAIRDPNTDLTDLGNLIRRDTGLAAQVIRMANSAFYAMPEPAKTIEEAVQRLGFSEVNRVVAAIASRQLFQKNLPLYELSAEMLWKNSVAVAVSAETIARNASHDPASAYLSGILHPVGMIALNHFAAAQNLKNLPPRAANETIIAWERTHFGTDNAAIAGRLLALWKFAPPLPNILTGRYQPSLAGNDAPDAHVLYIASCLAGKLGAALPTERGLFSATADRIAAAGLDWDELSDIEIESAENLQRAQALFAA